MKRLVLFVFVLPAGLFKVRCGSRAGTILPLQLNSSVRRD